ncbi:MAG: DNA translocase FtsK 4TM domain-containing protein [Candidatus Paceibacteria bacterium]
MAKQKKASKEVPRHSWFDDLSPQAKQAILAVIFGVVGVFFTAALFNIGGVAGTYTKIFLSSLFGFGAYIAPIICAFYVYTLLNPTDDRHVSWSKICAIALFFIAILGILDIYNSYDGGYIGRGVGYPLAYLLGTTVASVTLAAGVLISTVLFFNVGFHLPKWGRGEKSEEDEDYTEEDFEAELYDGAQTEGNAKDGDGAEEDHTPTPAPARPVIDTVSKTLGLKKPVEFLVSTFRGTYAPPALSLLKKDAGKPQTGDVKANSNIIKRTLRDFGINVEMDAVEIGPTITRYALKPAQGVSISKIIARKPELQLALQASSIRIEAPIPGRSLVGIEVPNIQRSTIGLASLLRTPEFTDSPHPLLVALGKDVTGHAYFANVARMPHGLIAGTTGSGKSITIHNLIISLLFRNSPEQLRFLMVDPKRVELTLYEGIPHLLAPVIVEPKKALMMLKWATKEMERRYDILQSEKIQNLDSYHSNVYQPAKKAWEEAGALEEDRSALPEPLPYLVIVMDELADLMQAYPKELEASIVRLAQMSRAVGIHLLLATQRPSVNVITGTIKANIPTRLALNVASQIDSRTILDQIGAESLLGKGDMLYLSSDSPKPVRLQSAFVSEEEIKNVVSYLKKQDIAQELDSINLDEKSGGTGDSFIGMMTGDDSEDDDDLYEDAKQVVIESGRASTSYIQRRLRVGYSRAARLMDILEDRGIIGPADGSKPRQILVGGESDLSEESEPENTESTNESRQERF